MAYSSRSTLPPHQTNGRAAVAACDRSGNTKNRKTPGMKASAAKGYSPLSASGLVRP